MFNNSKVTEEISIFSLFYAIDVGPKLDFWKLMISLWLFDPSNILRQVKYSLLQLPMKFKS